MFFHKLKVDLVIDIERIACSRILLKMAIGFQTIKQIQKMIVINLM